MAEGRSQLTFGEETHLRKFGNSEEPIPSARGSYYYYYCLWMQKGLAEFCCYINNSMWISKQTFMLKLTERQDIIGQILMGGIALAKCTSLDNYQKKHIERQIEMINESWEELRTKAMERQNK